MPHGTICFLPSSRLSPQGPPSAPTTATPQHPFHIHAQERQLLQPPCTNAQGRKAAQSEFSSRAPAGKHAESAAEQPCSLLAPSERRSQETGLLALLWCDCCWEHLPVEVPANTSLICAASRSQHHRYSITPSKQGECSLTDGSAGGELPRAGSCSLWVRGMLLTASALPPSLGSFGSQAVK